VDYEQIAQPFEDARVDNLMRQDGTIDLLPAIDTSIQAQQLIKNLNDRLQDSAEYWDDVQGQNLKYARAQSVRMVLGKQIDTSKLYRYQIPYIDNELHIAVDTIISYATAQTPRPEVYPAQNTDEAKILARDVEKAMQSHSDMIGLDQIFEQAAWNCLVKRVGVIKLFYDPDYGRNGEIMAESLDPNFVIVDKNVKMGQNPSFICEIHKDSLERLLEMFPAKKEEMFRVLGVKRGTPRQMTMEIVWREFHATVYLKNKPVEWVFCYTKDVMLDAFKDPNWLYNGNGGRMSNFLPAPMKMYVPINYLNDGSHWVDQTTPVEQAYSMQDVLNKRGRQIMENADTANGFLVFSSDAVTNDDVENLTGDPNQKLTINTNGRPIGELVMQIQAHQLPSYVVEDKIDSRTTLHSLMGTPAQFSGTNAENNQGSDTLGEAVMIKNQASGRQDRFVRCIERAAKVYFNCLAQMMRVHYDDKHWFVYNAGDGDYDRICLTRSMLDEGMLIGVRTGTTLPFDKAQAQTIAMNLAKGGLISVLDLYQDLHMDNPQQRYDNWVKWKTQPDLLARDAFSQQEDQEAYVDFIEIMAGKKVKPRDDASLEHVLTHRKQMITDKFLKAKRAVQTEMLEHVEAELHSLELRQALDQMSQVPQGLDVTNQPQLPPPQPPMPMGMPGMPPGAVPPAGGQMGASPPPGMPIGGGQMPPGVMPQPGPMPPSAQGMPGQLPPPPPGGQIGGALPNQIPGNMEVPNMPMAPQPNMNMR
jgi:hypothetical protein